MEVSGRRPTGSDGRKTSLLCDSCKGDNEDEPAVSYCTVCNEYLCHGCRKAHTKTTVTKGHLLMDQDSMPKQKPRSDKDNMCPKHNNKPIEFYCSSDGQFYCSVCATIDHKQCSTQYINDIAIGFHKSNEYVALEKASANLIRLLQETKDRATSNMKDVATIHANFISDLHHFRTEINNKLDSLEKAAMREVQIARDIDKNTLETIDKRCDSMLSDIHSLSSKLEDLNKYKQERQLVICCKRAAATIKMYGEKADELSKDNKVKNYKFQPNEKIRKFLDSLDSLGQIKEMKDGEETNSQSTCPDVSVKTSDQATPSYVGNIDVRHSTDKRSCCSVTGGVMIDQTNLALVDRNNSSVKVADVDTNTLVSCIILPTEPWDITRVNRDQIVVTCFVGDKGKLVFLKVGKSLSVLKELDMGVCCCGIVYSNNTLIVSFYSEPSVKIFDMNGNVLKIFKTNKAGDALFSHPGYISISTDQQTVFVSDKSNNTVMSLTLDGTVQHVYTADSLNGPRGLAVDRNDNVYIAGCRSHNIHQLSPEGNHSQVMLYKTHRGYSPQSMVTYCKTRHRLYISVRKKGFDVVSVYQLHP